MKFIRFIVFLALFAHGSAQADQHLDRVEAELARAHAMVEAGNIADATRLYDELAVRYSFRANENTFIEERDLVCSESFLMLPVEKMVEPLQAVWECPPGLVIERIGLEVYEALHPKTLQAYQAPLPADLQGAEGYVHVLFDINAAGLTENIQVVRSDNEALEPYAAETATNATFMPGWFKGRAVVTRRFLVKITYRPCDNDS